MKISITTEDELRNFLIDYTEWYNDELRFAEECTISDDVIIYINQLKSHKEL